MNAPLSITGSPLVLGNTFVVAIYAQSAPSVLLQAINTVGPYLDSSGKQIPFQVMFTNLTPQVYIILLWETSNGTASGRVENSFVISLTAGNAVTNIRQDLSLTGGTSTGFATGATIYSDISLVGWIYRLEKLGYGTLEENIDYIQDSVNGGFTLTTPIQAGEKFAVHFQPQNASASFRRDLYLTANTSPNFSSGTGIYVDGTFLGWAYDVEQIGYGTLEIGRDYTQDNGGGFTLLNNIQFQDGQKFAVHFQPNFQSQSSQPSPYSGTLVVTADISLTNADCGKAILIMGAGTHLTITLPLLATVNDYQTLNFNSCGGNHVNVTLNCLGVDGIQRKIPVGNVILAQDEQLRLYKALGNWQVDYISPTVDMVGQLIYSYDKLMLNTVMANGSIYQRADYQRLFNWMHVLSDTWVTEPAWINTVGSNSINRGFYTDGTNGMDFRVPDLTAYGIVRNVDGNSRLVGSFQSGNVGQHDHVMHGKGPMSGRFLGDDNPRYAGGGGDQFGSDLAPNPNVRTGDNSTDPENRMANTGIYALIRI